MLLTTRYIDEVEFLCDAFCFTKPGRIGIDASVLWMAIG
jgi:ABC-2 type transport system ATP-binding protein